VEAGPPSEFATSVLVPLRTCERVLDALRRYDERDAAVEALAAEIERARAKLLSELYGKEASA
jgi:hypothetical protein